MSRLALVLLCVAGVASADSKTPPTSKITFGAPVVTGSRAATGIAWVVKKSQRALVDCHAGALKLDGDVNVSFTIDGKGSVTSATAEGFDTGVATCVTHLFEKMKFGAAKGGESVDVTYPLTFVGIHADDDSIYGQMDGSFSFGRSGFGPGGGGTGWATIPHGSGEGAGYGVGGGRGGIRGRKASVPTVKFGHPAMRGATKTYVGIVRRYLKRNIRKLSYCYEKQLLGNSKLAGTVTSEFTIEETGLVSTSTAKGVDPKVESCIADVVKGIEFPKPNQVASA